MLYMALNIRNMVNSIQMRMTVGDIVVKVLSK